MVTIPLAPVDTVRITILMDNMTDPLLFPSEHVERTTWLHQLPRPRRASTVTEDGLPDALIAEPGFSALVRVATGGRERTILFDAGVSPSGVVENMRRLELAPKTVEAIVLSHGHWDHVAGMEGIAKDVGRAGLPVLIHPQFWRRRRIAIPGFEPGELPATSRSALEGADQAIVMRFADRGLVVLTGCGHAGIINIVSHAQRLTGETRVAAVIGGFHLSGPMFEPIIEPTVVAFDDLEPALLMPAHCTGWKAVHRLARRFPDAFVQSAVGTTISL
jgi:7,8-dihydropterin-6-yl-methyl-4-(beta-D-ribofuranosyl)aminobenzene 5'-phosphate synthase